MNLLGPGTLSLNLAREVHGTLGWAKLSASNSYEQAQK